MQYGWQGDARWSFPSLYYAEEWPIPAATTTSGGASSEGSGGANTRPCVQAVFIDTVPLMSEYRADPETASMGEHLNDPALGDRSKQLAWIGEQLQAKRNGCRASIVVGHHPVYSGGEHNSSPDLQRDLKPLLDSAGVHLVLSGHDHTLQHLKATTTTSTPDYVITGAGSKVRQGTRKVPPLRWFADENGFTVHSVNATHLKTSFVGAQGAVIYAFVREL